MKKIHIISLVFAAFLTILGTSSCHKGESGQEVSSSDCYFFQESFSFDLTSNPVIRIPVVRLGTSGDATVSVTSSGSSIFTVPSQVTITDGNRIGNLEVTYDISSLAYNETYTLTLSISEFKSLYGYGSATADIVYPTSFYEYGDGHIVENWWGEEEDKVMYARVFDDDILQCYLPDCWGDQSGPGYPVQDYVFYWNTATNMVYVPMRPMGCENWCIADRGAIDCMFSGPNHKEGSAEWMTYIDQFYTNAGFVHPYYDPAKKAFYLSDSAAVSPDTGEVVYGTPGSFDVFTLNQ